MIDKELADKVVALGVGAYDAGERHHAYWVDGHEWMDAWAFVCDWRVVGELMEKCQKMYVEYIGEPEQTVYARAENNRTWDWPVGENLPRLIVEACVEALTGTWVAQSDD